MLRKFYLRLLGYKTYAPFVHPLQPRARSVSDTKRNYTQLQISKFRDLIRSRIPESEPRSCSSPAVGSVLGSTEVREQMISMIERYETAVDRAFYFNGL